MTLVALDINATRLRALQGLSPREGRPILFEANDVELPLALNLEGRSPQPGRTGLLLCRRAPHLACVDFLPHLGDQREWSGPRCRLDAARALGVVFDLVAARAGKHSAAAVGLPGYLLGEQRAMVRKAAEQSRMKFFGTVDSGLAAALTAHAQQAWQGPALVADVDDHALTWSVVDVESGFASTVQSESHIPLGLNAWKEKLLDMIADICVHRSRRDPRDSAEAEQALFDQLDSILIACREGRQAEVVLKSWSLQLAVNPSEVVASCRNLVERSLAAFQAAVEASSQRGPIRAIVLSATVARLPGLVAALEQESQTQFPPDSDDVAAHVRILGPDAVAHAVLDLASHWQQGALRPGHLDAAPILEAQSPALGIARLNYRGRDYPFLTALFTIGRDPRCDLVFETAEYPSVSGQHCKIVSERGGFVLYDLSRHGTLINDRPVHEQKSLEPGDWIRLGPGGPLLRFLGHSLDKRKLMPTA
jgi:hypothetical protein